MSYSSVFDHYAVKKVTKTDKVKKAYCLTKEQIQVLEGAGIRARESKTDEPLTIFIWPESRQKTLKASYYNSLRKNAEKRRSPEPRLGREFITEWADIGDSILIGRIGKRVYVSKSPADCTSFNVVMKHEANGADVEAIQARAMQRRGNPEKITRIVQDFRRSLDVVVSAIIRAADRCEMPGCGHKLFLKDNGKPFLEVHHVIPLAEGGEDCLQNAAAICPACHRQLHHGAERMVMREKLRLRISNTT